MIGEKLQVMERIILIYIHVLVTYSGAAKRKQRWWGNTKYHVSKCLLRAIFTESLPKKLFVLLPIDNIQRAQV